MVPGYIWSFRVNSFNLENICVLRTPLLFDVVAPVFPDIFIDDLSDDWFSEGASVMSFITSIRYWCPYDDWFGANWLVILSVNCTTAVLSSLFFFYFFFFLFLPLFKWIFSFSYGSVIFKQHSHFITIGNRVIVIHASASSSFFYTYS